MIKLDQLGRFHNVTEEQKKIHLALCNYDFNYDLREVEDWKNSLISLNNVQELYNKTLFEEIVNHRWLIYCFIGLRKVNKYKYLHHFIKSFTKKELIKLLKRKIKIK
ncbi:hypothetical protein D3C75_746050 [compost metagenome]